MRVIKYVVPVVPQVRGRVIEVPVEPNRLVKKGELLFRIDPTPYQNDVDAAKAKLAADQARLRQTGARWRRSAGDRELQEQLQSASGQVAALQPRLELARLRVRQNRELVATGAGDRFALEQAEANVIDLQAQLATAHANEAQVTQKLSGQVNGELARWPPRGRDRDGQGPGRRSRAASPTRSGTSTRRRCTRRPMATRSTCSCGPARSSCPSRSRRR